MNTTTVDIYLLQIQEHFINKIFNNNMIFLAYLILQIPSIMRGIIDAILYLRRGAESFTWNEHWVLTTNTVITCGLFAAGKYFYWDYLFLGFLAAAFWLGFSFFHNGSYFVTKNAILKNNKSFFQSWTDYSLTDTSENKYDFRSRLYLMLFGLLILTIGHIVL